MGARAPAEGRRELLVDLAVAAALAAISVALVVGVVNGAAARAVAIAVALAHVLPLAVRRRWPILVVAAMAVTALASVPLGVPAIALGPAAAVGAYTVGARLPEGQGRRMLVGLLVVMAVVVVANDADGGTVVTNSVALGIAWWLGRRTQLAAEEVERERAAATSAAEHAVAEERLRIARELHDVVAHAMSVIAVQAGTGRFVIGTSPEVAERALATIEVTSREALDELRRLLAVLRDEGDQQGVPRPAPGLADLPALVEATTDAGVPTCLHVRGEPVELTPGLALCVYRIVQEALTNVRKHARAGAVEVVLAYEPEVLAVEVVDDGVGLVGSGVGTAGHGLAGMRERAALYGGTVEVVGGAGCTVRARLPIEASA